jgi:hypothetical protein
VKEDSHKGQFTVFHPLEPDRKWSLPFTAVDELTRGWTAIEWLVQKTGGGNLQVRKQSDENWVLVDKRMNSLQFDNYGSDGNPNSLRNALCFLVAAVMSLSSDTNSALTATRSISFSATLVLM